MSLSGGEFTTPYTFWFTTDIVQDIQDIADLAGKEEEWTLGDLYVIELDVYHHAGNYVHIPAQYQGRAGRGP